MSQDAKPTDHIHIERLEVFAHVGVPDDERSQPQRLTISITFWATKQVQELADDISRTVNYAAVCSETIKFVQARSDRLIETLADALAIRLLEVFEMQRITIELRKFILPEIEFVSVIVTRERQRARAASDRNPKSQVPKPKESSRIKIENYKKRERPS